MYLIDKHWPCISSSMLAFQFKFFPWKIRCDDYLHERNWGQDSLRLFDAPCCLVWSSVVCTGISRYLKIYLYSILGICFWWIFYYTSHVVVKRDKNEMRGESQSYLLSHWIFFYLCGIHAGILPTRLSTKNEIPQYKCVCIFTTKWVHAMKTLSSSPVKSAFNNTESRGDDKSHTESLAIMSIQREKHSIFFSVSSSKKIFVFHLSEEKNL